MARPRLPLPLLPITLCFGEMLQLPMLYDNPYFRSAGTRGLLQELSLRLESKRLRAVLVATGSTLLLVCREVTLDCTWKSASHLLVKEDSGPTAWKEHVKTSRHRLCSSSSAPRLKCNFKTAHLGWPLTHSPPASATQLLALQTCATSGYDMQK